MSEIRPMKAYRYVMWCGAERRLSGIPEAKIEWRRGCRLAFEDENGYWIPGTKAELRDDGDSRYEVWDCSYDPLDGLGSVYASLTTLDPNCMEEFKEEALKMAFQKLLLRLDELNREEKEDGARE